MTRATVGGINSEDNLWYPLAVNSQGIAQIDTSGIPQPLEWEGKRFTPYYTSDNEDAVAFIEYSRQYGMAYRLGMMCFIKIILQTSSCVITNTRGYLNVMGVPYTWKNYSVDATWAGGYVSSCSRFRSGIQVIHCELEGANLRLKPRKLDEGSTRYVLFEDLNEHSEENANYIALSAWGILNSTDPPPDPVFRNGILQETDEIPTGTP